MAAEKVAVWLTKQETQTLRRLIVEEARRLDPQRTSDYLPSRQWPSKLRRLMPVAKKIWEARQHFSG